MSTCPCSTLTVALVSTQRRWHGGEEQARLLALGLRQRGHRCVIVARGDGQFLQRMADEHFEVEPFTGGGRNLAAIWQIRRALRRVRPDVLHYNDSHAMVGAGLAAVGLPIASRIAARRVDFAIRSPRPYRWFCDRVICVSAAVEKACEAGGLPRDMLCVVHDGVDPGRVQSGDRARGRRQLGLADDQPLLLTVATLTDHKGHRFWLDAMPAVLEKNPRVIAALAGDGELREPLEQQAKRLGIEQNVRFLGFRQDVPDLIQAADVFVLPSHMEGLCSTLIDAMLAQRTIVATTAGGIPDLLAAGDDGRPLAMLVPPRDPKSLAAAVNFALTHPAECAEMRLLAADRAARRFTADCMVDATLAAYGIGQEIKEKS